MKIQISFIRLAWEPMGLVGSITVEGRDDVPMQDHLEEAFDAFNHGSGQEVKFNGPSASVGDVFVAIANDDPRTKQVWQIAMVGFTLLNNGRFG